MDFKEPGCWLPPLRNPIMSTTVEQVAACTLVTQRARVRSPVGTSFLGEVFSGFSSPVRQMLGSFRPPRSPNIIWPSLSSLLIHYGRQWPELLTRPKTSNKQTIPSLVPIFSKVRPVSSITIHLIKFHFNTNLTLCMQLSFLVRY